MAKVIVRILNDTGLHARPAAEFVKVASRFKSSILVSKNDRQVNGKSIMGVITLAAEKDSELTIEAKGEDAEQALQALARLVNNHFNEA